MLSKKFDGRMLLLGIPLIVLPPWFAWGLVGSDFLHIRHMLDQGTEATAVVDDTFRVSTIRFRGRRGRLVSNETESTLLRFDGREAVVPFRFDSDSVPITYDGTKGQEHFQYPRDVILGKKSDGYFSVLHQNHGYFIWIPFVVWTFINLFCIVFGTLFVVTGLGLRAVYVDESQASKVESKE